MQYPLLLLFTTLILECSSKSSSSSSRGSSSSRSSSGSSGSSGFSSSGSSSSGGGYYYHSTSGRRRVSFTNKARHEGFLHDSGDFYIVVKPDVPVPYYDNTYYWNRQYYISHPERHMCVREVTQDGSDLSMIRLNNSSLTEIVFGCSNEDSCCEFDCCNMKKRIIAVIILVIIVGVYLCCTADCMDRRVAAYREQKELKKRQEEEQEMAQQRQEPYPPAPTAPQSSYPPNPQLCPDHEGCEDGGKQAFDQQQQPHPAIRPSAPLLPPNAI